MSFHYEVYIHFPLLISFQVSDMKYKAVRTENTHLKGMMGDLDPGRYMVIWWNHSVNWTDTTWLVRVYLYYLLSTSCRVANISHTDQTYFYLQAKIVKCLVSPLFLSWIGLNSDHFLKLPCFFVLLLPLKSHILHGLTQESTSPLRKPFPLLSRPWNSSQNEFPSKIGLCFGLTCFVVSHFPTEWWIETMNRDHVLLAFVSPSLHSSRRTVSVQEMLVAWKGWISEWLRIDLVIVTGGSTGLHKATSIVSVPFNSTVW